MTDYTPDAAEETVRLFLNDHYNGPDRRPPFTANPDDIHKLAHRLATNPLTADVQHAVDTFIAAHHDGSEREEPIAFTDDELHTLTRALTTAPSTSDVFPLNATDTTTILRALAIVHHITHTLTNQPELTTRYRDLYTRIWAYADTNGLITTSEDEPVSERELTSGQPAHQPPATPDLTT